MKKPYGCENYTVGVPEVVILGEIFIKTGIFPREDGCDVTVNSFENFTVDFGTELQSEFYYLIKRVRGIA